MQYSTVSTKQTRRRGLDKLIRTSYCKMAIQIKYKLLVINFRRLQEKVPITYKLLRVKVKAISHELITEVLLFNIYCLIVHQLWLFCTVLILTPPLMAQILPFSRCFPPPYRIKRLLKIHKVTMHISIIFPGLLQNLIKAENSAKYIYIYYNI